MAGHNTSAFVDHPPTTISFLHLKYSKRGDAVWAGWVMYGGKPHNQISSRTILRNINDDDTDLLHGYHLRREEYIASNLPTPNLMLLLYVNM
ncbi:hypothetical protein J6590_063108 [Homalodisca vitripennis]|nr:hypothetical protein J6590_063108 [Homalodisca vitripennis]